VSVHVLATKKHRVLHITLNRPEKRNALTLEMSVAITDAIRKAQEAPDIGCILISANGPVFCAGMDLDEASELHEKKLEEAHDELFSIGAQSLKPIVVAANGTALGGGLGLVAQGHVVLATEGAVFGLPEIRIGLWPFLVYRSVSAALGPRRTLELSLTGQPFHAEEAFEWGLVSRICPPAEIADRARSLARQIAKVSPQAVACGMRYVRDAAEKSWSDAGKLAAELRAELMESADFREGCLAFKQKREARWPSMPAGFYEASENAH
jgi:enoyl-CoA hydratase/carnithine racemase